MWQNQGIFLANIFGYWLQLKARIGLVVLVNPTNKYLGSVKRYQKVEIGVSLKALYETEDTPATSYACNLTSVILA